MNVLLGRLGDFCATYKSKTPYGVYSGEWVNQAISDLKQNCCIHKSESLPVICSPLSMVTSSAGKYQLVTDLQYLNGHLLNDSFKCEDLRIAMMMFQKRLSVFF